MPIACPYCARPIDQEPSTDTPLCCPSCGGEVALPDGDGSTPTRAFPSAPSDPRATVAPSAGRPVAQVDTRAPVGYEILGELGRGGMGVVYRARHVALDRVVALKMILAGAHAGEDELRRFRTEAEAIARLQHPGIVAVYEIGEHDGRPFISLEFCPAGSLEARLRGQIMKPGEAAALVRKLAQAVQAAHEAKVIHRDLNPANVLLAADGTPKVTDFGLAKKLDAQGPTVTGAVMGTPSYLAPEQALGKKEVGQAADTYALGAVLYECLTGRPPFRAATVLETLQQVVADEPVSVRQLQPSVPRDLETICHKCLRKESERRYASARELGDDLGRFLAGEPIEARPVGAMERVAKWVRRNPALAASSAAVMLALALGAGGATWFGFDARREAREARKAREDAELEMSRADKAASDHAREAKEAKKARDEAKKSEETAKAETYRANAALHALRMRAALQEWQRHDVRRAEAILDEVPPEFQRTWECRHVRELCRRKTMTLRGHTGGVRAVAYSPDGERLVSAGYPYELKVWDARTGQDLLTMKGEEGWVNAVAFSPDGSRIVSGGLHGALKVWDARSGRELLTLGGYGHPVRAVACNPDGSRVASGSDDGTLNVWDARTGKRLLSLRGHVSGVTGLAFSPDGSRIASGAHDDKEVKVWDARSGDARLTLEGGVARVAYSPDGSRIASGGVGGAPKVWDARTGRELLTLAGHVGNLHAMAFSRDGSRVVSAGDKMLKVWDARTGHELLTLAGHDEGETGGLSWVSAVACSPDGLRIASGSPDRTVKVWDAGVGQEVLTLAGHKFGVDAVAYSPDGSRIASGGWTTLKVWDARTGQDFLTCEGHSNSVTAVAYSPDGSRIVSGSKDRTLKLWDARTGKNLLTLEGHKDDVTAVAFSPDGSRIVSGSADGTPKVWDARTGKELLTLGRRASSVGAVAYSPDGRHIASGSYGTLKVWDAETGLELLTLQGHADWVTAVAYSPKDSRLVSASVDDTVKVWDADGGRLLFTFKTHTSGVRAVAFSPDGSRLASAGQDSTLKVWDARTAHELLTLLTLKGHAGRVSAVAFSPDGSCIASGSEDRTVKVWGAPEGQELLTLKGHGRHVSALAFSPDGSRLASAGGWDRTLKVWDARTGQELSTFEGHVSWGRAEAVAYSNDGSRLLGSDRGGRSLLAWDARSGKALPEAPADSTMLRMRSAPLATHGDRRAFVDGPFIRIERLFSPDQWQHHCLHEGRVESILRVRRDRELHAAEIQRTQKIDPFACVFHLDRLLALSPDDRPALLKRRAAVLTASLESDANDHHSARSFARQAVADFTTIDDPKLLLPVIARHQHAAADRLHGALLLRTGNPRVAAIVLRAAIRHRPPAQPPIDELLLALALIKLGRRDEARQHLKTAADWMDHGTAPQRLTALVGLRPAGPLAALGALAHVPDVRLNPLDPFTAHELATLRAEVQKQLAAR